MVRKSRSSKSGRATGCRTSRRRVDATKVEFIERLVSSGLRRIEVASFVNPRACRRWPTPNRFSNRSAARRCRYTGLVLNRRGFDRALAAGCNEIGMAVVASDTFNRRNQGVSTAESIAEWIDIAGAARAAGIRAQVTISAVCGCPFEGEVPSRACRRHRTAGRRGRPVRDRACRYDRSRRAGAGHRARSSGAGRRSVNSVARPLPQYAQHGHWQMRMRRWRPVSACSTPASAASAGVRSRRRRPATSPTEDLIYMLERSGVETGISTRRPDRDEQMAAGAARAHRCRGCSSRPGRFRRFQEQARGEE